MMLSVITPCSRPLNLPTIYSSILNMNSNNVEWIIVFDNIELDERILSYETTIPIKLFKSIKQIGDNYASRQRNIGIENANGDYLYFLDDDNLVHKFLHKKIKSYSNGDNILIFNQFNQKLGRILKPDFNIQKMNKGQIDTAQFVVPRKYNSRWRNDSKLIEEYDYLCDLINEVGYDKFKYVDKLYTFRNYLRRFDVY